MDGSTIAVLGGTGQQGRGIARRLAQAGAHVVIGSREPARARDAVAAWTAARTVPVAGYREAIAAARIVVLAVPFPALDDLLRTHEADFPTGATIVDVTVPLVFGDGKVDIADIPDGSASEYVRARVRDDVRVAGAFKTVPARMLNDLDRALDCDEFVCGDSPEARQAAADLVAALDGLRPVDVGGLSRARAIESLTFLAVAINRRHRIHDARFRVVGL